MLKQKHAFGGIETRWTKKKKKKAKENEHIHAALQILPGYIGNPVMLEETKSSLRIFASG